MLAGKILVGVLLLGWRFLRLLAPIALRGHGGGMIEALSVAGTPFPSRSARYIDGLAWTTLLALALIGIPLTLSDQHFVDAHGGDVEALLGALETQLARIPALGWL